MAQPFNAATGQIVGEVSPAVEGVSLAGFGSWAGGQKVANGRTAVWAG
jgi:hypothetical protein